MLKALAGLIAAVLLLSAPCSEDAHAQGKKLKIGVIFDYTGPLAGGGSDLHALGAKIMIDYFAKKGGVEGYAIEAVYADAQSKPDDRHQRGGAPDRAGEGRHAARLLLLGPVRARGRPGRAAQEVHVDHHLHLLGGAREPQSQVRLPHPAERPAVRPDVDRLHRPERQGQARQGAEGPPRGDHPRGRRLRGRRVQGQRGRREEGGLQHRAEGGLCGDGARSLAAGDQAQARPARRHLPHGLQPRHHAVPAPVARARACASPRWSATAPATASTTSSRKRSART